MTKDYKTIKWKDYIYLPSAKGKYKVIGYYPNGNIWYEQYCINNKLHRENGPAYINYNKNGNIESEYYWLCDKSFTKEYFYSPKIRAILDIVKMMDIWEQRFKFIKLSLQRR